MGEIVAAVGRERGSRQAIALTAGNARFKAYLRPAAVGHQPTVVTGSFLASRLIEVTAEATAN